MKHARTRFDPLALREDVARYRTVDLVPTGAPRGSSRSRWPAWILPLLAAVAVALAAATARADVAARASEEGPPSSPRVEERVDSDQDGIADRVELRTGTDPLDADTDADGVDDGEEDLNHDGIRDPGERNPRVPGLHHGAARLPEPMVFDLVRSLGARNGEIEANTLVVVGLRPDRPIVSWAPEVEWAIVDDFAVELELPMVDTHLHALKAAAQLTLPSPELAFAHGVQVIAEVMIEGWAPELSALYLLGGRMGPLTLFGMVGLRTRTPSEQRQHWDVLVNPTVAVDLHEAVTVGVETNVAVSLDETVQVSVVPQIAWQVVSRFRLQVGGGVTYTNGEWTPLVATRLILE